MYIFGVSIHFIVLYFMQASTGSGNTASDESVTDGVANVNFHNNDEPAQRRPKKKNLTDEEIHTALGEYFPDDFISMSKIFMCYLEPRQVIALFLKKKPPFHKSENLQR